MNRPPISQNTLEEIGRLLQQDPGDECHAWLDRESGEVFFTQSLYGLDPDANEQEDVEALPTLKDWQEAERRYVQAVCADTAGRYVRIPVGAENGAPGLLSAFASTLTDPKLREEVYAAMRGRGAFRRVKDILHHRGQIDLWHRYEEEHQRTQAREWLEGEGIEVGGVDGTL